LSNLELRTGIEVNRFFAALFSFFFFCGICRVMPAAAAVEGDPGSISRSDFQVSLIIPSIVKATGASFEKIEVTRDDSLLSFTTSICLSSNVETGLRVSDESDNPPFDVVPVTGAEKNTCHEGGVYAQVKTEIEASRSAQNVDLTLEPI
jgi:hypothetical protein